MRKIALLALALFGCMTANAQLGALQGFCTQGGVPATTQGLKSTNNLQGVIPSCTVSVFLHDTQTLATIFANETSGPLSNPFTAVALGGVAPGSWIFWVAQSNTAYDIVLSGGIPPNTYATPVSLTAVTLGTGSGGSSPPIYSVQFAAGTNGTFGSDPSITINPTAHSLTVGSGGTGGIVGVCGTTSGNCVNQESDTSTAGMYVVWPSATPTGVNPCLVGNVTGTQSGLPLVVTSWDSACGVLAPPGFGDQLAATIGPTDTTFALSGSGYNQGPGFFYVDTEYIYYQSIVGSTVTVVPDGRGWFGTTATSHVSSPSSPVIGCALCLSNPALLPYAPITGNENVGGQVMGINNSYPNNFNGEASLNINGGTNTTMIDRQGGIHQLNPSASLYFINGFQPRGGNEFEAPIWVGSNSVAGITDTSFLVNTNVGNQITSPMGIQGGIAGPVSTVQAPTIGAPTVFTVFNSGTTTWTYVCQGVDSDGNAIPGTPGTVVGAASIAFPQSMAGQCPFAPGAASVNVYRTTGGPNVGLIGNFTQQAARWSDFGNTLNGAGPVGTNGDIPRVCNNNFQYCLLSGTSGTPPVSCTSAQQGWEYHNVSATSSPFVLHCVNGSSWTTAY
jgi:hypothetical protein